MLKFHPYLMFNGQCEEAFDLYKSVFGGEFTMIHKYKDAPSGEGHPPIPEDKTEWVMNMGLPINDKTILYGSDAHPAMPPIPEGHNVSIHIDTQGREDVDRIFAALSEGGRVDMPVADTFWGAYFGGCKDKYGISWMISYDATQQ